MPKFRKKPVVIDAIKYDFSRDYSTITAEEISLIREANLLVTIWDVGHTCPCCGRPDTEHFVVPTLEGHMLLCPGDWLIKGILGEFYPCKPDIFEKTYEKV